MRRLALVLATAFALVFVGTVAGACDEADEAQPKAAEREGAQAHEPGSESDAVVGCRLRAEGPPGLPKFDAERDFRAGKVTFYGLRSQADVARRRPGVAFKRRPEGYAAVKVLAGVEAGQAVTVAVAPSSRDRAGLIYAASGKRSGPLLRLNETERAVEFRPCHPDEPRWQGDGNVGRRTHFSGGFLLIRPHCLRLRVSAGGQRARVHALPYGVPERSC